MSRWAEEGGKSPSGSGTAMSLLRAQERELPLTDGVPAEAILAQLNRILASATFRYSERLSRFLKFVVEQRLAGNASQLKEAVLAVEIFDRKPSYDSRVDSIVRVEARRLRDKLDKYYSGEGSDDPVTIVLPKGTYVPAFLLRHAVTATPAPVANAVRRPVPGKLIAAASFLLVAVAFAYWMGLRQSNTSLPLRRLTSDAGLTFQPALSPDGTLVAYSSDRNGTGDFDIWLQQVPGGQPHRLTEDSRDEVDPAFSPDGMTIAYRAEGDADGIYTIPTLGGKSTLLARGGYRPRFSPDGSRIAFWIGERSFRTSKIFIVPTSGGTPVQLAPEFSYAAWPLWSPDGRYIVFVGNKNRMKDWESYTDNWDWWVVPAGGGPAVCTFARDVFKKYGLAAPQSVWTYERIAPGVWLSDGSIICSARSGDHTNIWRIPISRRSLRAHGPVQQVTFGSGRDDHASFARGGTLVFSVLTYKSDVWSLPLDVRTGEPNGHMIRLTSGTANHMRPVVSTDGSRVAFVSNPAGNYDVWTKDLTTGREIALSATREDEVTPILSPDATTVAFGTSAPPSRAIFAAPFSGGSVSQLCSNCGEPRSWLPDGRSLLYQWVSPSGTSLIAILDMSGRVTPLVQSSESALFSPSISHDGKWVTLVVRRPPDDHRVAIIPLRDGSAAPQREWIFVTEPGAWVNKPRWSPEADALYYVSDRDGFVCVWMCRLDPKTKTPVEQPRVIAHFHNARASLGSVFGLELSVAKNKLVFNLGESSGNIWLAPSGN
ncbi:MAG: PD40 domain-containing protein [Bryobacteraceae bacterium]|nr:PD40 domain-containing protein [Bryobacteraceae bacterium]